MSDETPISNNVVELKLVKPVTGPQSIEDPNSALADSLVEEFRDLINSRLKQGDCSSCFLLLFTKDEDFEVYMAGVYSTLTALGGLEYLRQKLMYPDETDF